MMESSQSFKYVPLTPDEQYESNVKELTSVLQVPASFFASLGPVIERCVRYYSNAKMNPILREYEEMLYELESLEKDIQAYARQRPADIQKVYKSLSKRFGSFYDRESPFINKITALADQIPVRPRRGEAEEDIYHNLGLLNQFMETNASALPQWLKDQWAPLKEEYNAFRIYPNTMERVHAIWNEVNGLPNYADVPPMEPPSSTGRSTGRSAGGSVGRSAGRSTGARSTSRIASNFMSRLRILP